MPERRLSEVERFLHEGVGAVFPAAQLVVHDRFRRVVDVAVGDCAADTLFDIASLTKALSTATLLMQRPNRRTISLDDEPRPGLTVRHLLSHSSGLPAWKLLGPDPRRAVLKEPLEYPTGTKSVYSDLGFILLGDHLERVTTLSLVELFADCIATPLGVGTTFEPEAARCAPTEGELRGVVHDENARALGGAAGHAGLFSTARDVARIAAELVDAWHGRAETLVAQETVRRFWSPSGVPGSTWCLGWDRPSATASSAGTRWPRDGVGHLGFTGCSLWIDPPRGRFVVLLSNRVHPSRANEAIKAFRPALHDKIVAALDG